MAAEMCVKTIELRSWYKVRWKRDPPGYSAIAGKVDLVMGSEMGKYREYADILAEIKTQTCAAGVALGFGKASEEKIEQWVRENAVSAKVLDTSSA